MEPYYKQITTTMCDFEPFYKRIAQEMPDNCSVVEVGVADGYSALMLAYELKSLGKNFTLFMVDNCDYGGTNQMQDILNHVYKSGLLDHIVFIPKPSLDASCRFNDNGLDFVFIDASHEYEPTKADIRLWYRKVKTGGILAGHDYWSDENPGVAQAADEVIPAEVLNVEKTDKGLGVFWVVKDENVNMN